MAPRQKPRIAEALTEAGFGIAMDLLETPLFLRVTVGNEKGFRSCGTRNNVKFALRREGNTVLEFTEAGWTGSCEPNVFDMLAKRLASEIQNQAHGE